ncbi:LCP family protein [Microbacteriaceae bacterium VKM Ac-2854]|nr:LCP family protein [Microbacteriaceae bacterium VKM Ac-2854]
MRRTPRTTQDADSESGSAEHARPYARHGRLKRFSVPRTIGKSLAVAVGVSAVASVSVVAVAAGMLVGSAQPSIDLHPAAAGSTGVQAAAQAPGLGALEGGFNVLVVGSDSRKGQGEVGFGSEDEETSVLNDVNMLMHVSADHQSVSVVSFPRDTYVDIPSCVNPDTGETVSAAYGLKINEALGRGGLGCVAATIEQLMGIRVDYGAVVQFNGVIEMSNAVGGVDVCVATEIDDNWTNVHLEPGTHTLQGMDALQFLRSRHGIGDGSDLTRISNQQVFLSALVRKVKSAETLTNPVALYGLGRATLSNMVLSNELNNVNTLVQMGLALSEVDLAEVVFVQYPTVTVDGGVEPNVEAAAVLAAALQNDQAIVVTGGTGAGATTSGTEPAPAAETPTAETPTAETPAEAPTEPAAEPTAVATAPTSVALPESITGQPADQQTCSVGFFG